jgi:phenylpropionate dioxygenase-like ring-hydroxylating dioxygenase large terminal subunit
MQDYEEREVSITVDRAAPVAAKSEIELPEQNPTRRIRNPIPAEGENGLFSESWFPICLSEQLKAGELRGESFLDGKVVAYRGEDGAARVMSAYCPHVGADLSIGRVIGNNVQCPFHHWEYNQQGACVKTALGDAPPRLAKLFKFPTVEHYGIVWAFNGNKPHWELPKFARRNDQLKYKLFRFSDDLYNCDPWVFAANTPDMQHLKVLHKTEFSIPDPHDLVEWTEWGLRYTFIAAHQGGIPIEWRVGIDGTSVFIQEGPYGDFWLGGLVGFGLPRPGKHEVFAVLAIDQNELTAEDSEAQAEERFAMAIDLMDRTVNEDKAILNTIHYNAGTLTRGDKTLAKYLEFLRAYPRSHLSKEFIS